MAGIQGGYVGQLLRVDLSKGTFSDFVVDADTLEKYLGGVGLGARILLDEVPAGVDAFDPANRLIFASGPIAGTSIPGSGTYSVVTKGPLTGLAAATSANGWFGARMKSAGYDGIIFQGASPKLVYLLINDGKAEIRDASKYVGVDTYETEKRLKEELKMPNASVVAIGLAGENTVRFACIVGDSGHVASTNGAGAVMGSKKLKAIVVNGKANVPVKDKERLRELAKEWVKQTKASPIGACVNAVGTAGFFTAAATTGWLPIKNMTTNLFEPHAKFNGDMIRANTKHIRRKPCHACPHHHCNEIEVQEGPFKGTIADEPEYEGMAGFGPLIGNTDPGSAIGLNDIADRLGMDLKECSFTMALAIDCFENGVITKKDTDGLELKWGSIDAIKKLMPMIANRQGFGNLLAEGVYRTAQKLGPKAIGMAVYSHKGIAPHVHDPRGLWGFLFGQAISNFGSIGGFTTQELTNEADLGYPQPVPKYTEPVQLVDSQGILMAKYNFIDSLGVCFFTSAVELKLVADALTAITGVQWTREKMLDAGYRIETVLRIFNIRQGWTRDHDSISHRLSIGSPDGPNKGIAIEPVYQGMVDRHYANMGWDKKGHPNPETLNRLGVVV